MVIGKISTSQGDGHGCPLKFRSHAVGCQTQGSSLGPSEEQMSPRLRDPAASTTVPKGQASGERLASVACGHSSPSQLQDNVWSCPELKRMAGRTEPSSYGGIRQEAGTPFRGNGFRARIWGTDATRAGCLPCGPRWDWGEVLMFGHLQESVQWWLPGTQGTNG